MTRESLIGIILGIAVALVIMAGLVAVAGGATCSVGSPTVYTYTDAAVTLDTAPAGLSGYEIVLTVADPTKAEIYSVTYPSWATISSTTGCPGSSCTLTAADLGGSVSAGATNVNLATVKVRSIASGTSGLNVAVTSMDDDVGAAIGPTTSNGTITSRTSTRVMATGTVTTLPTDAYQGIKDSFGGNNSPATAEAALVNWSMFIEHDVSVYQLVLGNIALVIIFSIPFILMWLMQQDVTIPSIVGIILGVFVLAFLPSEYHLAPIAFIGLSITAIFYTLLKERM